MEPINTFIELFAGFAGVALGLWLFFTRATRARETQERLERLPRRVGETSARSSTTGTFALVSGFLVVLSVGLILDAGRRLIAG
ncbi:hypothetical protein GCM10009750_35130 [Agromyces salentinus]|uniref:Uncharacterized protein n=1 Tax=Agromyces salentinus TaxID=269421 RepID=A0ABP4ZC25_9MICO